MMDMSPCARALETEVDTGAWLVEFDNSRTTLLIPKDLFLVDFDELGSISKVGG